MKKSLLIAVAISTLALAGCVAVPYGDPYGGYRYGYAAPAPAVVVQPSFGYYGYYGRGRSYR